ncbi:MAG: phosphatidate cytidylyltransferase [Coriobacteriia bacterium]|nr:phosphatidate cytidylyltransferase [Coriobacteriia bacterium]
MVTEFQIEEPEGIKPVSFFRRTTTAGLYGAVVLVAILLADYGPFGAYNAVILGAVFGTMAALAAREFYVMAHLDPRLLNVSFGVIAAGLMPICAALWGMAGLTGTVTALIAVSFAWHVLFVRSRMADTATTVFGALYTGFLLGFLVLIVHTFHAGMVLALAVVISSWANDSLAYLVGSIFGRHKLLPRISPKKSVEGLIAGFVGTLIVWVALALLIPSTGVSVGLAIALSFALGLASIIGDLFESRLKREAGVKDSGNSLPGHGGFLDRLDALILTCLVAYWILHWGGVQ